MHGKGLRILGRDPFRISADRSNGARILRQNDVGRSAVHAYRMAFGSGMGPATVGRKSCLRGGRCLPDGTGSVPCPGDDAPLLFGPGPGRYRSFDLPHLAGGSIWHVSNLVDHDAPAPWRRPLSVVPARHALGARPVKRKPPGPGPVVGGPSPDPRRRGMALPDLVRRPGAPDVRGPGGPA